MKPDHRTVAVVLLALVTSSLLGVFPHEHRRSVEVPSGREAPSHGPHDDTRLEIDGFSAPDSACAICFFQRVLSKTPAAGAQTGAPVPSLASLSIPSDAIVPVDVAFVAEPRGPPAI